MPKTIIFIIVYFILFLFLAIFQNNAVDNLEDSTFSQIEIISELLSNKTDDQQPEEPVINNLHNSQ